VQREEEVRAGALGDPHAAFQRHIDVGLAGQHHAVAPGTLSRAFSALAAARLMSFS
jgi:hypothetical protein